MRRSRRNRRLRRLTAILLAGLALAPALAAVAIAGLVIAVAATATRSAPRPGAASPSCPSTATRFKTPRTIPIRSRARRRSSPSWLAESTGHTRDVTFQLPRTLISSTSWHARKPTTAVSTPPTPGTPTLRARPCQPDLGCARGEPLWQSIKTMPRASATALTPDWAWNVTHGLLPPHVPF